MKAFKFFFILIGILIIVIGAKMTKVSEQYEEKIYQDSLSNFQQAAELLERDSMAMREVLERSIPPEPKIQSVSDLSDTYLSAAQGVEVSFKGMEWQGMMIDSIYPQLKHNYGARYVLNYSQIELDPDFPGSGSPDLLVTIPEAPLLYLEDQKSVSRFLRRKLNKDKPIESYHLQVGKDKKVRMDLWLANFEVIFRVLPDKNHDRNREYEYEGRHPITRISADKIRGEREYKNQRYGNMTVFLEFKPKKTWYIGQPMESGIFETDRQPEIGIAAVECIKVVRVDEKGVNKNNTEISLTIENGQSIPLYNSLEAVQEQFVGQYRRPEILQPVEQVGSNYYALADDDGTAFNRDLFGKTKYSAIQIKNLGSWKTQAGWFLGNTKYEADLFKAHFLIHLFVIGEWTVKPQSFVKTDVKPPTKIVKKGLIDFLLPDFRIGLLGKIFSGTLGIIILIVFLSVFFPPLGNLVNGILKKILSIFGD